MLFFVFKKPCVHGNERVFSTERKDSERNKQKIEYSKKKNNNCKRVLKNTKLSLKGPRQNDVIQFSREKKYQKIAQKLMYITGGHDSRDSLRKLITKLNNRNTRKENSLLFFLITI